MMRPGDLNQNVGGAPTVIDLIENFFQGQPERAQVEALAIKQIDDFRDAVKEFSEAQASQVAPAGTTYLGGWLGAHWASPGFRDDRTAALLYYQRLLVHDPLADFFFDDYRKLPETRPLRSASGSMAISAGPSIWAAHHNYDRFRSDRAAALKELWTVLSGLQTFKPLIVNGTLIVRSQWPTLVERRREIEASVRKDVWTSGMHRVAKKYEEAAPGEKLLTWDNLRGMSVVPNEPLDETDVPWIPQNEFMYLAKTLAVADAASATYAPTAQSDLDLLTEKLEQISDTRSTSRFPEAVLREVARIVLPSFELDAKTAVKMRQSEADFDDWRRSLSELSRISVNRTDTELREIVKDSLLPQVHEVERLSKRPGILQSSRAEFVPLIISSAGAAAAEVITGGKAPLAVASLAAAGGAISWMWNAYRPTSLGGRQAVLASLLTSQRTSR